MDIIKIDGLRFTYPLCDTPAVNVDTFGVPEGSFVTLCGRTGSGKSTLLRLLKPQLVPAGEEKGEVMLFGKKRDSLTPKEGASLIGFVGQDPNMQLVTDKVWHELAFCAENLGLTSSLIRRRTCEIADFFGITGWFDKNVNELSGGQKQIVNLASVLVTSPKIILLDEPTSMLDPVSAEEFVARLVKLNRELGLTVIVAEHRLDSFIAVSDLLALMENGRISLSDEPKNAAVMLKNTPGSALLPTPARIFNRLESDNDDLKAPLSVKEGKGYIVNTFLNDKKNVEAPQNITAGAVALELKDVFFTFKNEKADVLDGLSLSADEGEILCIHGPNGSGKSTALLVAAGLLKPSSGKVKIFSKKPKDHGAALYKGVISLLPQDVTECFLYSTVKEELKGCEKGEKLLGADLSILYNRHPFDLSGGQMQLVALAKALSHEPKILLLDEPTKGLDNLTKNKLSLLLKRLKSSGMTIVCVTHDLEFSAMTADRCALIFRGKTVCSEETRDFFSGNRFYTTSVSRMTEGFFENAVTEDDCVALCRLNGRKK
ncbi:MAG: ATP-binding cassette domain-containing protein [Clostridia bacterium]|nr:ATP-binding cassette domain-containing protein [Clostridia bacterium]